MTTRNFRELEAKMDPKHVARAKARAARIVQSLLLAELRKQSGKTQAQLAKRLGVRQPTLSKLESQRDMQISTLRRIVHALGGELEIHAKLRDQTVDLSQFAARP